MMSSCGKFASWDTEEGVMRRDSAIRRVMSGAAKVTQLVRTPGVCTWQVTTGGTSCVVKSWPPTRLALAAQQYAAEAQASVIMKVVHGIHLPIMPLTMYNSVDPSGCSFTITPYAGACLSKLRSTTWAALSPAQLEKKCKRMAVCVLQALTLLEQVPDDFAGRKLHRDIKLDNLCWQEESGLFSLIDLGALCSLTGADWFSMLDWRYVDSHLAALDASGQPAAFSLEGQRSHTTASLDMYQLALAVVELYQGHLPSEINWAKYGPEKRSNYMAALRSFLWHKWAKQQRLPADMQAWLSWLLNPNPELRPASATDALDHPWLAAEVPEVVEAVTAALPAWEDMREALEDMIWPQCHDDAQQARIEAATAVSGSSFTDTSSSNAGINTPPAASDAGDLAAELSESHSSCSCMLRPVSSSNSASTADPTAGTTAALEPESPHSGNSNNAFSSNAGSSCSEATHTAPCKAAIVTYCVKPSDINSSSASSSMLLGQHACLGSSSRTSKDKHQHCSCSSSTQRCQQLMGANAAQPNSSCTCCRHCSQAEQQLQQRQQATTKVNSSRHSCNTQTPCRRALKRIVRGLRRTGSQLAGLVKKVVSS